MLFPVLVSAVIVWISVFLVSKIVSLASLVSTFSFLILAIIFYFVRDLPLEFVVLSLLLFLFIVLRHKKNIRNILAKKELHF